MTAKFKMPGSSAFSGIHLHGWSVVLPHGKSSDCVKFRNDVGFPRSTKPTAFSTALPVTLERPPKRTKRTSRTFKMNWRPCSRAALLRKPRVRVRSTSPIGTCRCREFAPRGPYTSTSSPSPVRPKASVAFVGECGEPLDGALTRTLRPRGLCRARTYLFAPRTLSMLTQVKILLPESLRQRSGGGPRRWSTCRIPTPRQVFRFYDAGIPLAADSLKPSDGNWHAEIAQKPGVLLLSPGEFRDASIRYLHASAAAASRRHYLTGVYAFSPAQSRQSA